MKINKIIAAVGLSVLLGSAGFAQTEILSESEPFYPQTENWGPNRKNHLMLALFAGQFLPIGGVADAVKISQSRSWSFTLLYKRKLSSLLSLNFGFGSDLNRFGFRTDQMSLFSSQGNFTKELLNVQMISAQGGIRFNFDKKRGDHLGHYLDMGVTTNYLLGSKHILFASGVSGTNRFNKTKTIESGLNYLNPFHYGILARFGINRLILEYRYQASSFWADDFTETQLPKHQLGLSLLIMN